MLNIDVFELVRIFDFLWKWDVLYFILFSCILLIFKFLKFLIYIVFNRLFFWNVVIVFCKWVFNVMLYLVISGIMRLSNVLL